MGGGDESNHKNKGSRLKRKMLAIFRHGTTCSCRPRTEVFSDVQGIPVKLFKTPVAFDPALTKLSGALGSDAQRDGGELRDFPKSTRCLP